VERLRQRLRQVGCGVCDVKVCRKQSSEVQLDLKDRAKTPWCTLGQQLTARKREKAQRLQSCAVLGTQIGRKANTPLTTVAARARIAQVPHFCLCFALGQLAQIQVYVIHDRGQILKCSSNATVDDQQPSYCVIGTRLAGSACGGSHRYGSFDLDIPRLQPISRTPMKLSCRTIAHRCISASVFQLPVQTALQFWSPFTSPHRRQRQRRPTPLDATAGCDRRLRSDSVDPAAAAATPWLSGGTRPAGGGGLRRSVCAAAAARDKLLKGAHG